MQRTCAPAMQRNSSSHLATSGSAHHLPVASAGSGQGSGSGNTNSPLLRPHSPSSPAPVPFHLLTNDDEEEEAEESSEPAAAVVQPSSPNGNSSNVTPAVGSNLNVNPDASSTSIANDTLLPLTSLFSSFASTVSALAGGVTGSSKGTSTTVTSSSQATLTPAITTPDTQFGARHPSSDSMTSSPSLAHRTSSGSMHASPPRRPLPPSLSRSSSRQMSNTSIHGGASFASSGTPSAMRRTPSMVAANTPLPNSGSQSHLPTSHALYNSYYHPHHSPLPLSHDSRSRNASLVLSSGSNQSHGHLSSSTSSTHLDPTQGAIQDTLMQQLADRDARISQLEEQLRHLSSTDTANQRLIADLEQQISELTTGKRQVTQDLAVAKRELATNMTTLSKAQDERDTHLARVRDLESDLDRIKQIASGLGERLSLTESRLCDVEHEEAEAKQQVEYWQLQAEELHGICDRLTAELEHRESILGEIDLGSSHALGEQLRQASPTASSRAESPTGQLPTADHGQLKVSTPSSVNNSAMTLQPSPVGAMHGHFSGSGDSASGQELGQQDRSSSAHTIHAGGAPHAVTFDREDKAHCARNSAGDMCSTPSDTLVSVHDPKASNPSVGRLELSGSATTLHSSGARAATISSESIQTQVAATPALGPAPVHLAPQTRPPEIRRQRSLQDELMVATASSPPPEPSSPPSALLDSPLSAVQHPQPKVQPQLHALLTRIASRVYKHRHTLSMSDSDFDSFLGFLDDKAGVTFVHVLRAIASSGANDDDVDDGFVVTKDAKGLTQQQQDHHERAPDSAYIDVDESAPGKFDLSKRSLADLLRQDDDDDGHERASCGCHSHSDSHPHSHVRAPAQQSSTPSQSAPAVPYLQHQSIWRSILAVYALNLLHLTGARVKQATIPNDIDNPRLGKHVVFSVSPTPETGLFSGKWAVLNGWIGVGAGVAKKVAGEEVDAGGQDVTA